MIRPLRRRHRWIIPACCALLIVAACWRSRIRRRSPRDRCQSAGASADADEHRPTVPSAWNPQKRRYDLVAGGAGRRASWRCSSPSRRSLRPELTIETLLIRALGAAAFMLLHVILCIGPLARLDRRFLPLLYNRRHLGVMMFTLALAHGVFAIVQFHALGTLNPLVSVLVGNRRYGDARPASRSSRSAWRRSLDPVPDGGDQPRLLAAQPDGAGVEGAAHGRLRRLRADRAARAVRRAAGRDQPRLLALDARRRRADGRSRCTLLAGATGSARAIATTGVRRDADGFVDVVPCRRHSREAGGRDLPVRRAGRGLPLRRPGLRDLERLPAPERSARRRPRSSTAASSARGTATSTCPTTGASPPPFTEKVPTFDVRVVRRSRPGASAAASARHARRAGGPARSAAQRA